MVTKTFYDLTIESKDLGLDPVQLDLLLLLAGATSEDDFIDSNKIMSYISNNKWGAHYYQQKLILAKVLLRKLGDNELFKIQWAGNHTEGLTLATIIKELDQLFSKLNEKDIMIWAEMAKTSAKINLTKLYPHLFNEEFEV